MLTNGLNVTQVQEPTSSQLSQALSSSCSQTLVLSSATNQIYTQSNAYSIDICGGSVTGTALDLISGALFGAWLEARPGKKN